MPLLRLPHLSPTAGRPLSHRPASRGRGTVHRQARAWSPRLRPGHLRLVLTLVLLAVGLGGGWLVVRDSGLVAVDEVVVTGVSGSEAGSIRAALRDAGQDMTTLHVRPELLREAVAPYAVVRTVSARPDFPHGLRVDVVQYVPVAALAGGGRAVAVAGDGTLLPSVPAAALPLVKVRLAPAGDAVRDPRTLGTLRLLAAAPAALRAKVTTAFRGADGLSLRLENGPAVRFGPGSRLRAKWAALQAVLVSPAARGATAIDVRVPEHPAAAGLVQGAAQLGQPSTSDGG